MLYNTFCGKKISALGLGSLRFQSLDGETLDRFEIKHMIDFAMKNGINYFDTAHSYHGGRSERLIAKNLSKYPRDSYYIACKYHIERNFRFEEVFFEQLEIFKTDYIDFYMLHGVLDGNYDDYMKSGVLEFLIEQKRLGRIKHLGFSSHLSHEKFKEMLSKYNWDFVQLQVNWFDWYEQEAKLNYELAEKNNLQVVIMEPFRGGRFSELPDNCFKALQTLNDKCSLIEWSLRFVKSLKNNITILTGVSNLHELEENVRIIDESPVLCENELIALQNTAASCIDEMTLACSNCNYCVNVCPSAIPIPEFIKKVNFFKITRYDPHEIFDKDWEKILNTCLDCKSCSKNCPQDININFLIQETIREL